MPEPSLRFELLAQCPGTKARRGRLHTPHGTVETPAFMPVGTQGAVKTLGSDDLEELGFELILANAYHLALRPGAELIRRLGGLGKFMGWRKALLTDSGGYQVMSLARIRSVTDEGVHFRAHTDGSQLFLSPEVAVQTQADLGVDISMALDECPPYPCTKEEAAAAMKRTHRWAARSLASRQPGQSLFGIVQGGVHDDLRTESAGVIGGMKFDGFAIGGVSVGEPPELQRQVVAHTAPLLPRDKARYLMGVGHPQDVLHAVASGIDLFDCVLPTRLARHHTIYSLRGRINIMGSEWAEVDSPIDPESVFPQTERYSAAYVRHLFKAEEPLGMRIATLHNLAFYSRMMAEARAAIEQNRWAELLARYEHA